MRKKECKQICRQFKTDKSSVDEKIMLLKKFANLKGNSCIPYLKKRQRKFKPYGICFICEKNQAICKHHIFQLQNHGYNKSWNLINICEECHSEIHPWLVKTPEYIKELDNNYRNTLN